MEVTRIGNPALIQEDNLKNYLWNKTESGKEDKKEDRIFEILYNSDVIASTIDFIFCSDMMKNYMRNNRFDYIIADEAAQIKEFQLVGLCDKATRLIMAGDQHQLPPFYEDNANRD